ncbi:phage major capsid protein [Sinorhizobium meliloti]|uniref:phage major capsid protein n=1 Tax=Rhizobium meliloti TaxID=382 RepID=UPI003D64D045
MTYTLERVARQAEEAKSLAVHTSRALRDLKRGTKSGLSGRDRFVRHAVLRALATGRPGITYEDVYREVYRERAATSPAMMTVPTWAAELAAVDVGEFLADGVQPLALARLAAFGRQVSLDGLGSLKVPYRPPGDDVGGWVGEGAPIPVDSLDFGTVTISPRKAAAVSTFTNELRKRATADIETLLETALRTDLASVVDAALVDDQPGSALRPAGLRFNVAAVTASTATDPLVAMRADLAKLAGEIMAGGGTMPVFLVNPVQMTSFGFLPNIAYGVIDTPAVPAGTVIAVDGPGFISGNGSAVIDASKDAVLHEDTAPSPIVAGGTAASPTRSLWQTDSIGVRAIIDVAWGLPAGRSAWMQGVTW